MRKGRIAAGILAAVFSAVLLTAGTAADRVFAGETASSGEIEEQDKTVPEGEGSSGSGEEIRKRMMKTGGTGFAFSELEILTEGAPFIPVGELNRFRRDAIEAMRKEILDAYRRIS